MNTCKGSCALTTYEPKKLVRNAVEHGYKRCRICNLFLKWEGIWCPCCSVRLSSKSKNNKSRQAFVKNNFKEIIGDIL